MAEKNATPEREKIIAIGAEASAEKQILPEASLRAQAKEIAENGDLREVFSILWELFPLTTPSLLDRSSKIDAIFDDKSNINQGNMTREQRNNEVSLLRSEVLKMLENAGKV